LNSYYPFINMPLPYPYNALEPYIDTKTMELHHDRHLQTYIDNLNSALAQYPMIQKLSLEQLILASSELPTRIRNQVHNNAGGVYNHRFYFNGIGSMRDQVPTGRLAQAIDKRYGSFERFKDDFKAAALSVFGSGYAWLTMYKTGILYIVTTANQDTPLELGLCPILNTDVWEHAYYLKHYNKRADYIDDWFHVIDWAKAGENYERCLPTP